MILFYGFVHAMCDSDAAPTEATSGSNAASQSSDRTIECMSVRPLKPGTNGDAPRSRRSRSSARCFGCSAMYIAECKAVIPPRRDWVSMPYVGTASSRHATLPARPLGRCQMDGIASSAGVHSGHARTCINKQFHHRRCGRKHGHRMQIHALPNHAKVRAIRAQRVVDPRHAKFRRDDDQHRPDQHLHPTCRVITSCACAASASSGAAVGA